MGLLVEKVGYLKRLSAGESGGELTALLSRVASLLFEGASLTARRANEKTLSIFSAQTQ